jgi:GNAT superfamily N-acetyltransferase
MGIALFYQKYSTWKGRCLFLEDLVVSEKHRRLGIGKALFDKLVAEARTLGSMRLEWQVLGWNEPAIQFYKKINAQLDGEWINCKLDKDQLEKYQR